MSDVPFRISILAGAVLALSATSNAQDLSPPYDAVCKPGGKKVEKVSHAGYWQAFLYTYPIAVPFSATRADHNPAKTNCGPIYKAPSVRRSFQTLVAECGYQKALEIALTMSSEAFEKPPRPPAPDTTMCPKALQKTDPTCKQLATARAALKTRFRGGKLAVDECLEEDHGSYALCLQVNTTDQDEPFDSVENGNDTDGQVRKAWDDEDMVVACGPEAIAPAVPALPNWLIVGKDSSSVVYDVDKPELLKKRKDAPAAEISLSFDRNDRVVTERDEEGNAVSEEYNDIVDVKLAVGYQLPNLGNDEAGPLGAFASLAYKSNFDATKETDDLAFGVQKIFNSEVLNFPEVELAWVTDIEQRESAQWLATGKYWLLPSEISNLSQRLSGGLLDSELVVVGDYNHVIDPGDKVSLAEVGETTRLGYEFNFSFEPFKSGSSPLRPSLKAAYQYRDTIGEGRGDADLWTAELGLLDLNKSRANLKLVYNRGENIVTLEETDEYKFVLSLK